MAALGQRLAGLQLGGVHIHVQVGSPTVPAAAPAAPAARAKRAPRAAPLHVEPVRLQAGDPIPDGDLSVYVVYSIPGSEVRGVVLCAEPRGWDKLRGLLRGGELFGSGARLKRVDSIAAGVALWESQRRASRLAGALPYCYLQ